MKAAPCCIVCGKPIAKRTRAIFIRRPQAAIPASVFHPEIAAKNDGDRQDGTLWLEHPPRSKAEAQRLVNGFITKVNYDSHGAATSVNYWDGESYRDDYFHADRCAIKQGYASAQSGERFTWRKKA